MSALGFVTGTSSGIGRAFAERLAGDGYDVVVGCRRDRLDDLAASLPGVDIQVVAADLTTDVGIDAAARCAEQPLTTLVNNPGSRAPCRSRTSPPRRPGSWCTSRSSRRPC